MDFDGEITYHECQEYANNPAKRTAEQSEHGKQAKRHAKWHVYRDRGHETVTRYENPDSIVGAMLAVGATPQETVDELFGELLNRVRTHSDTGDAELPFDEYDPDGIIVYRQDIYIEPDPLSVEPPLADQFAEYFSDPAQTIKNILGDGTQAHERLLGLLRGTAEPAETLPEFEIDAVSDLHFLYSDGISEQTHWGDTPYDREPDARIELMPLDHTVFDSTKQFIFSHLGNQVRDAYLLMGEDPPSAFQQTGLGSYVGMKRQQLLDMYDEHFLGNGFR